jgi:hypothetical protein
MFGQVRDSHLKTVVSGSSCGTDTYAGPLPFKDCSPSESKLALRSAGHPYSAPACWFLTTTVIIRPVVALNAALKSKLASTPAGPSIGVLASAR